MPRSEEATRGRARARRPRLEDRFDPVLASRLALREKQIQQNYRPIIGIHKWFARRPGAIFRSLLLAEFADEPLAESYFRAHRLRGIIADPFVGGGTPTFEANRLGFHTVGADINPMAVWIVRQSLDRLNSAAFRHEAANVLADVEQHLADLYRTTCLHCGSLATVKYFLWVKTSNCPSCRTENDLFPGYLVAEAERHPKSVVACAGCGWLNEYDKLPTRRTPGKCTKCAYRPHVDGTVRRGMTQCSTCGHSYRVGNENHPPAHRLWAIEYHCCSCKPRHTGRFFKQPDADDHARVHLATRMLRSSPDLMIPDTRIPGGDETARLHRWGYSRYQQMFSERQLLGLGRLLCRIAATQDPHIRHALLTVFSDCLRYQNMLCRYDTYALKCQDIFSVHGFPVGLVQCENNLLGIPNVGSGSFRHFVEKYCRAKEYCDHPFEIVWSGKRKQVVQITGEAIRADLVGRFPSGTSPQALLLSADAARVPLRPNTLDGVFTDPPYFDNVQYAELMDFCYAWLRLALRTEFTEFNRTTTRDPAELTGNDTLGRGLADFTEGLSRIYCHYAAALRPGAPFVFTYHHNEAAAYAPIVVAILDAGLSCTATLPAAAEMTASLHISGTGSSVLDSVFVCRTWKGRRERQRPLPGLGIAAMAEQSLRKDADAMTKAGVRLRAGDLNCLLAGHIARAAITDLRSTWNRAEPLQERMETAQQALARLAHGANARRLVSTLLAAFSP